MFVLFGEVTNNWIGWNNFYKKIRMHKKVINENSLFRCMCFQVNIIFTSTQSKCGREIIQIYFLKSYHNIQMISCFSLEPTFTEHNSEIQFTQVLTKWMFQCWYLQQLAHNIVTIHPTQRSKYIKIHHQMNYKLLIWKLIVFNFNIINGLVLIAFGKFITLWLTTELI